MSELPTMTASSYSSQVFDSNEISKLLSGNAVRSPLLNQQHANMQAVQVAALNQLSKEQKMASARIVKVYIADPNENLPLEKRVLHSGDEKLTDLTDQELFFEVPIADLLAKHNELRKTVIDKSQAEKFGRDIFLEPARIRDLKMVVVSVASF